MQDKSFEYGGHHFIPERQFTKREDDFFKITRRLKTDRELGFFAADYYGRGSQKFPYSYDDFYAAFTDRKCDIFRCNSYWQGTYSLPFSTQRKISHFLSVDAA